MLTIRTLDQLNREYPHPVLAMGSELLETQIQANKLAPKGRKVTSLRAKPIMLPDFGDDPHCLITYSVGVGNVDTDLYTDLLADFNVAARWARTGSIKPILGDYAYVDDFAEEMQLIQAEYQATGKPVRVALDTETTGLDAWRIGAHFLMIQLTWKPGRSRAVYLTSHAAMVAWLAKHRSQLDWLLNCDHVWSIFANGKYDLNWFWTMGELKCTNFRFDTTAVGSLLDENRKNSLCVHTKLMVQTLGGYDDEFNATVDKAHMELVEKDFLLPYGCGDTDACLQVAAVERKELLADPPLAKFYSTILHPACRAFEQIEQGGVLVDINAFGELDVALKKTMVDSAKLAKEHLGGVLLSRHADDTKIGGVNLTKPALLHEYLFSKWGLNLRPIMMTSGGNDPSKAKPATSAEHLAMFEEGGPAYSEKAKPFLDALRGYRSAAKMHSTYCVGFRSHIRSDGRLHPSYYLFKGDSDDDEGGSVTGRLSCREPAFQTIPKHNDWADIIRRCFPAPPGHVVVGKDYAQGELKIMACLSGDPNMLAIYQTDRDMHAVTGGLVNGMSYDEVMALKKSDKKRYKTIRQRGKAGNFGLIFEISASGFVVYARRNYGVIISIEEAEEFIRVFFGQFPGVRDYQTAYKAYAHAHGRVVSPLGRVRHLPLINSRRGDVRGHAERQAINSPVQSTLTDMMIWALAIAHARGWDREAPCFGVVHDQGLNYVPADDWQKYVLRDKEIMENLPFHQLGWDPQLKFTTDVTMGPNMGDMDEYQLRNGVLVIKED